MISFYIKYSIYFLFLLISTSLAYALPPKEKLILKSNTAPHEYVIVLREKDQKLYKIKTGIGCFIALLDSLNAETQIYAQKLGDLLAPQDNGNIALLHIKTANYNTTCRLTHIEIFDP